MNLYDIRLLHVRTKEIHATSFEAEAEAEGDDEGGGSYRIDLSVELVDPIEGMAVGDVFNACIDMVAAYGDERFFTMSMIGAFEVLAESAIKDLTHPNAPYELGSLLYPYIRNLAKPIIEYLGEGTAGIPFAPPPPPPPREKRAVRRKKEPKE